MSTPTTTVNVTTQKADTVLELQALISGINTLLAGIDPFNLARQMVTRADLLARAQARLNAAVATKTTRQAMHNAVAAERDAQTLFKPLRAAFRAYLVAAYGANAPELQQFGYVQNRRPKKTVASKATAVVNAKATRTARATKGTKQKAAIKGTVPAAGAPNPPPAAPPASPPIALTPSPAPSPSPAHAPGAPATPTTPSAASSS